MKTVYPVSSYHHNVMIVLLVAWRSSEKFVFHCIGCRAELFQESMNDDDAPAFAQHVVS